MHPAASTYWTGATCFVIGIFAASGSELAVAAIGVSLMLFAIAGMLRLK